MSGSYKGRREDDRFVSGRGRYTSDWNAPGQLYAAFRRSDMAHARLASVDATGARTAPGVRAVLTAEDLGSSFGTIVPAISYQGRGADVRVPEHPLLARDRVRYVGEEIALVVADSAAQANDALEQISIDYDELPAVIGVDAALADGAPVLHDCVPGNLCFDFDYGSEAETTDALRRAPRRVSVVVESPRVSAVPMEPRSVLAWYDEARGTYEIRCCNQGGDLMAMQLAMLLRTEPDRIRVHMVDVGGGFGPRAGAYSEYAVLLEAAKRLRRPIKWTSSRSEDFLCDSHGRGVRLQGELGFDNEGRFLALRAEWLCDEGAYLTQAGARTNTFNGFLIATGPYRIPNMYARHRLALTNAVPTDAYRGAGRPEAALVIERLVDAAATELAIDALELRRRNALSAADFPHRTLTGSTFDSGDFTALIGNARRASDWDSFPSRRQAAERRGAVRGIGCALFVEPCGGGFVDRDEVALQFSGDAVIAYVSSTSNGQGHETVLPELIAARLGIEPSRIVLRSSDPDGPRIRGNGTIGSRTALAQGSALVRAADAVVEKGKRIAADLLEAGSADIDFTGGHYLVRGTDLRVGFDAVMAKAATNSSNPLDTILAQPVPRTFTTGAHVAEVEIDRDTGLTSIVRYVAVDDVGKVISPVLAHGQIHGGVVQAIGQVLGERCLYDESSGQLLSGSFMDYTMPRADTVCPVESVMVEIPSPSNALGAKGAGETGVTGGLAALTNAVLNALASAGVRDFSLPATPHRVWQALQSTR